MMGGFLTYTLPTLNKENKLTQYCQQDHILVTIKLPWGSRMDKGINENGRNMQHRRGADHWVSGQRRYEQGPLLFMEMNHFPWSVTAPIAYSSSYISLAVLSCVSLKSMKNALSDITAVFCHMLCRTRCFITHLLVCWEETRLPSCWLAHPNCAN